MQSLSIVDVSPGSPSGREKLCIHIPFVANNFGNTQSIAGWSDTRLFEVCETLFHAALRNLGELNPFESFHLRSIRRGEGATTLGEVALAVTGYVTQPPAHGGDTFDAAQDAHDDTLLLLNTALAAAWRFGERAKDTPMRAC